MKALTLQDLQAIQESGVQLLDIRPTEDFKTSFIPGSIHVPGNAEPFQEWSLAVLDPEVPVVLITESGAEPALASILQHQKMKILGYLEGGFNSWKQAENPVDMIIDVESDELMMDIPFDENLVVMDVRKPIEFAQGHLKDAINLPLTEVTNPIRLAAIEETDNLYLHCGGGTRSVIAASVLKKQGIHNLRNIAGGWKKIKEEPKAQIEKDPGLLN